MTLSGWSLRTGKTSWEHRWTAEPVSSISSQLFVIFEGEAVFTASLMIRLPPSFLVHLFPYLRHLCRWSQKTSASSGGLPKKCRGGKNYRNTSAKMKRRSSWSKSKKWEWFRPIRSEYFSGVSCEYDCNPFVVVPFRKGRGHQRESRWSPRSSRNRWWCITTGGRRSWRWGKAD